MSANPSLSELAPRLLVVSNRLPVSIKRSQDGTYDFSHGSGGLVTGLSGLAESTGFIWYGWPGQEIPEGECASLSDRLKDDYGAVPIFLDEGLADLYYNGFSSKHLHEMVSKRGLIACARLYSMATHSLSPRRNFL